MTQLSIFPKFLQSLSMDDLAGQLRDSGFDACNAVIRADYWCRTDDLSTSLPKFTSAMRNAGLICDFATWAIPPEQIFNHQDQLSCLADNGLRGFRMGYFNQGETESYPQALHRARDTLKRMADLCQRVGLRAVYQVHHGRLITSPESAALLFDGLPSEHISVMLDVGNQGHEGACDWNRAESILGETWTHLGVKDQRVVDRRREWCPCQEGMSDFKTVIAGWQRRQRPGMWVLMPFYHQHDLQAHLAALQAEVSWLRQLLRDAED